MKALETKQAVDQILSVTRVTNANKDFIRKRQESRKIQKFLQQENHFKRSSKKERREDALAPGADEGRDKLRKAAGRCK